MPEISGLLPLSGGLNLQMIFEKETVRPQYTTKYLKSLNQRLRKASPVKGKQRKNSAQSIPEPTPTPTVTTTHNSVNSHFVRTSKRQQNIPSVDDQRKKERSFKTAQGINDITWLALEATIEKYATKVQMVHLLEKAQRTSDHL